MQFDVLSLFPEMFTGPLTESILKRAITAELIKVNLVNIRDYATGKHQITDEPPYGGGAGMVIKVDPVYKACEALEASGADEVIVFSPGGERFDQQMVDELSTKKRLVLLCGRYEGFDQRVTELVATRELSLGDFVITGGELAAMVVIDAISRKIPGVVGQLSSVENDSFFNGLLDYPHYTRPVEFMGRKVPDVLLSGHHGKIAAWRAEQSQKLTAQSRPDLWEKWKAAHE